MVNLLNITEEKLYDLSSLEQIAGDTFVQEVVKLYLHDSPEDMLHMRSAVANNIIGTVQTMAHKLKSSAGTLQADRLFSILEKIELTAKTGDQHNELINLVSNAQYEFDKLETALRLHFCA